MVENSQSDSNLRDSRHQQDIKEGNFTFEDLQLGTSFRNEYHLSADLYQRFVELFGDRSPLHVDDAVAASCGFRERLMYGAMLNGFISNFVGMHFPGKRTLELGVDIRFVAPFYQNETLILEAVVKERLESRKVILLHFRFLRDATVIARGKIQAMICDL
jgi:acyl dehydratase